MADKRPKEEQDENELNGQKKQKESHADLLKKGIALRVSEFLGTSEGKKALEKGKSFFVQQFLKSWESDDIDSLKAYKEIIGKKVHEELTLADLADVIISYDETFTTYIEGAEKEQFTAIQEKAIAQTFLDKMNKEIQGKYFQAQHRDVRNQYVSSKKDIIRDRGDLDKHLKIFFAKIGASLSDEQKKRLQKVTIELRDVASHMTEKGGFTKEATEKLHKKDVIVANTDVEDMVKRFLRSYARTEVLPAYESYEKASTEISSIYKVPGFQRVLEGYDFSIENLIKTDKAFAEIYKDAAASQEAKVHAQQKAIVSVLSKKDKELGGLVDSLFASQFNLSRLDVKQQQAYMDRFHDMRSASKEMSIFDDLFTKIGATTTDRKDLMKQIFDLSKNELTVKTKAGKTYVLSLQKKVIDRPWSAETISESMAHPFPLTFLLSANDNLDEEYIQRVAKVQDKGFTLTDAQGKEQKVFPGHLIEVTTKDGKKHIGYVYKDPEGNIILSQQPGSDKQQLISADDIKTSTVRIVESTYALSAHDIPVLLTHVAVINETNERSDEENRSSLHERNVDIAKETLKEKFERERTEVKDEEIKDIDWDDATTVAAITAERKDDFKKHIEDRMVSISGRIDKIDKEVKDLDKIIQTLQQEVTVGAAKKPLSQEQADRLQANLTKAQNRRDDLIDEKTKLMADAQALAYAQKKLNEKQKDNQDTPISQSPLLQETVEAEQDFGRAWAELNGDKTLTYPQPGKSCVMALLPDAISELPGGGGAWVRGDIVSFDEATNTMQIKWYGVEGALASKEGGSIEGSITTVEGVEGLKELKRLVSKIYKFKKYRSIGQWGIDLKGGIDVSDDMPSGSESHFHFDKKYDGWRKHLKDEIDFPSMKQQKTGNEIKYFGKKGGDARAWFSVETLSDGVRVKEVTVEGKEEKTVKSDFNKVMTPNDFMMFAMEKDLRGYTQEEVDVANQGDRGLPYIADWVDVSKQPEVRYGKGLFNMRWGSIAGIASSRDIVKKGVKNYFDEKAKKSKTAVENAMLGSSWFSALEGMPYVGGAFEDIRGGFESKQDTEKKKKIGEFKDEVDQKKGPDSSGASRFILESLKDPAVARKEPLKAAGYYLYALQEGGNPYFRALKEEQGKGRWIERILGPDYVPQYKAYIANLEAELKKDPSNDELKTALYKDELGFLQNVWKADEAQLKPMYGSWFFTGGLGVAYNTLYNGTGISKTYEGDDKNKSFGELHGDSRPGFFEAFRVNDYIAYSKLLSEKVGPSDVNYYKWAGFVLMPFVNGQSKKYMNSTYQYEMVKIAKKASFPFAGYMTEGNGMEKLQELFDMVSDGALSKEIAAAGADEKNSKLPDITKRGKGFQKWRETHGRAAIDKLQNSKELFVMKKDLEKNVGDQDKLNQYNTLTDYINHKYNDEDRNTITETYGGDSIIYQKNIFSAPSGFVKQQMLDFANAQFKGKAEKSGPALWEALKGKLIEIQNIPEDQMSKDFFVFLMKRYLSMFQSKYTSSDAKKTLVATLKFPHIPMILQQNVRGRFDKKLQGGDLPGEVSDTLIIFEQLFAKYSKLIENNPEVIGEIFDDPRMTDHYLGAKAIDTVAIVNNQKNEFNRTKKLLEAGHFDTPDYDFDSSYF